ncbi:hypothetical protein [Agaribacter flavus]|uniref:Uncharacterized protein n=1 Tax=Agaribacter flavus TaxID=1902781 RepID=A0ABV7FUF2_9ALTE
MSRSLFDARVAQRDFESALPTASSLSRERHYSRGNARARAEQAVFESSVLGNRQEIDLTDDATRARVLQGMFVKDFQDLQKNALSVIALASAPALIGGGFAALSIRGLSTTALSSGTISGVVNTGVTAGFDYFSGEQYDATDYATSFAAGFAGGVLGFGATQGLTRIGGLASTAGIFKPSAENLVANTIGGAAGSVAGQIITQRITGDVDTSELFASGVTGAIANGLLTKLKLPQNVSVIANKNGTLLLEKGITHTKTFLSSTFGGTTTPGLDALIDNRNPSRRRQ